MSHVPTCRRVIDRANPDARCDCFEPDTDWAPNQPCGGISTNGATPPLCEVHMKPWGHRWVTTNRPPETDEENADG